MSQIFYTGVEPLETDLVFCPKPGRSTGTTLFGMFGKKIDVVKDSELTTSQENVKTDKKWRAPILRWDLKRGHTLYANLWTQNQRTNLLIKNKK